MEKGKNYSQRSEWTLLGISQYYLLPTQFADSTLQPLLWGAMICLLKENDSICMQDPTPPMVLQILVHYRQSRSRNTELLPSRARLDQRTSTSVTWLGALCQACSLQNSPALSSSLNSHAWPKSLLGVSNVFQLCFQDSSALFKALMSPTRSCAHKIQNPSGFFKSPC